MNIFFDLAPSGRFEARPESIGTDVGEIGMLAHLTEPTPEQARRIEVIRENLRHAMKELDAAAPAGTA